MHTIGDTIDRRTGLPADSLCEAALAIFIHELDCRALAVVDGDRPIGIVHREPFLARMERAGAALLGGFIVCRGGDFAGVSDLARLLPALSGPRHDVGLIERICTEVREPIAHALAAADGLSRLRLPEGAAQHL